MKRLHRNRQAEEEAPLSEEDVVVDVVDDVGEDGDLSDTSVYSDDLDELEYNLGRMAADSRHTHEIELPPKTNLVQKHISNPQRACDAFGVIGRNDTVPIVLIPPQRHPLSCWYFIPSGVYCVQHKWGKAHKTLSPAGKTWAFACYQPSYLVSMQACTYSAPVSRCPTADDVMVDVNLKLVFHIGPGVKEVKAFVYNLGAARFDEFLYASLQEAIRILVRSTFHSDVRELRGLDHERVGETLLGLNRQFNMFGVHFSSAVITDVVFSRAELTRTLQETTEYRAMIKEHRKRQRFLLKKIDMTKARELCQVMEEHELLVEELRMKQKRIVIERGKLLTQAKDAHTIATTQAQERAEVDVMTANANVKVVKTQAMVGKAKLMEEAEDQTVVIRARQAAANEVYRSEVNLRATRDLMTAFVTEAIAEDDVGEHLKFARSHSLRMTKLGALGEIAAKSKLVITGETGDRVIESILDQTVLDDDTVYALQDTSARDPFGSWVNGPPPTSLVAREEAEKQQSEAGETGGGEGDKSGSRAGEGDKSGSRLHSAGASSMSPYRLLAQSGGVQEAQEAGVIGQIGAPSTEGGRFGVGKGANPRTRGALGKGGGGKTAFVALTRATARMPAPLRAHAKPKEEKVEGYEDTAPNPQFAYLSGDAHKSKKKKKKKKKESKGRRSDNEDGNAGESKKKNLRSTSSSSSRLDTGPRRPRSSFTPSPRGTKDGGFGFLRRQSNASQRRSSIMSSTPRGSISVHVPKQDPPEGTAAAAARAAARKQDGETLGAVIETRTGFVYRSAD